LGSIKLNKIHFHLERYFEEFIHHEAKFPSTVKANILQLLGMIAQHYPSIVSMDAEQLIRIFVRVADYELFQTKKKPELLLVSGALKGLNSFLFSFGDFGDESDFLLIIFKSISVFF